MKKKPSAFRRRDFLKSSAAIPTFSLFYFAGNDQVQAASSDSKHQTSPHQPPNSPILLSDSRFDGEPNMQLKDLECDLLIAGGGPSGVCSALAAARNGTKVILVQDRSRLGGNSSSEVKMHIVGANMHRGRPGWREGGIIEELRLDDATNNPHRSWELWDLLLYDKIISEPNIQLLLDSTVYAAEVQEEKVTRAMARCDKTETLYRISAKYFADCTGDARLAMEAGASIMWGHESRETFNEPLAWEAATKETLGSSILFTARDYGKPIPYKAPKWARRIEPKHLNFRPIGGYEYGYWWIEWGGHLNTIQDNEEIRHELLAIVTGIWDYIKNSGNHPDSANWGMDWVGMMPGKRESRRIVGDHILTQQDLMGLNGDFEDAVAIGGWGLDEHPPGGFDDTDKKPFVSIRLPEVYNIPLRSLYSKDLSNLFMAGRNASCSHVAFTSTRVMATCAVMGQAMGTAAAICTQYGITPRELYQNKEKLAELQEVLLKDDQTIKHRKSRDPFNLTTKARVSSSETCQGSSAENIQSGFVRDMEETFVHRWVGKMKEKGAWIELSWEDPQTVSEIHLTFDSGFHRELTLTSHDGHNSHMKREPQPETIKNYQLVGITEKGAEIILAEGRDNHQRLVKHTFDPQALQSIKLQVEKTNGLEEARIYDIRCYG
ncbi:MAG: FAD-dependent oxidoreductase [Bacteroidota bacterium]